MSPTSWPLFIALGAAQPAEEPAEQADVQALFAQARTAEATLRYADARTACTELIALAPTHRRAATCAARLQWLAARTDDDGGFTTLAMLQQVRATHRSVEPDEAARRVTALLDRPGASELVRVDATLWLARDALDRRGDPQTALSLTEPLLEHHRGPLRRVAVGLHARALAELGRIDEAVAAEAEIRVDPDGGRRSPAEEIVFRQRTRRAAWFSGGWIAVFALVASPLAWRRLPAHPRPWGLLPLAVLALGAGAIAEAWSEGAGAATGLLFAGFSGIHLLAGPALHTLSGPRRAALSGLSAGATLAAAYLALYFSDTLPWVLP